MTDTVTTGTWSEDDRSRPPAIELPRKAVDGLRRRIAAFRSLR
jgi:hypothetical protein